VEIFFCFKNFWSYFPHKNRVILAMESAHTNEKKKKLSGSQENEVESKFFA
jgi:hypothetical protein